MTGQQCWGKPSWPLGLSPLILLVEKLRCRKPSHLAGAPSSSVTAEGRDPGLPASPSHTTSYSLPPLPPLGTPSPSRPSLQATWALQQTTWPSSEWRLGKLGKQVGVWGTFSCCSLHVQNSPKIHPEKRHVLTLSPGSGVTHAPGAYWTVPSKFGLRTGLAGSFPGVCIGFHRATPAGGAERQESSALPPFSPHRA